MATWYISGEPGASDSNPGTITQPFRSTMIPSEGDGIIGSGHPTYGDTFLFKCGYEYPGVLRPAPGIDAAHPSIYGNYGSGPLPKIRPSLVKGDPSQWTNVSGTLWKTPMFNSTGDGPELTTNGDFATGTSAGWTFALSGTAAATSGVYADSESPGYKALGITITTPGVNPGDILLYSGSGATVPIVKYHVYRLQFRIKGATAATLPAADVFASGTTAGYKETVDTITIGTTFATGLVTRYIMAKNTNAGALVIFAIGGMSVSSGYQFAVTDISLKDCGTMFSFYDSVANPLSLDVGMVTTNGIIRGDKQRTLGAIASDYQFYSDPSKWWFYMQCPTNPGLQDTRIAMNQSAVVLHSTNWIQLSGFEILESGGSGVSMSQNDTLQVYSNVVHTCGGSYLPGTGMPSTDTSGPRAGNGIELFDSGSNITVQFNRVWQCYDVAFTVQGRTSVVNNVNFYDNVAFSCEQMYEIWQTNSTATMTNVRFERNTCIGAGYGWSRYLRPDPKGVCILQYFSASTNSNVTIRSNVFAFWRDAYRFADASIGSGWIEDGNLLIGRTVTPLFVQYSGGIATSYFDILHLADYTTMTGFEAVSQVIPSALATDHWSGLVNFVSPWDADAILDLNP